MADARLIVLKLALDELGLSSEPDTPEDRMVVQLGIYLVQITGLDLGYRFSWHSKEPFDPELAADYAELTRRNGRIARAAKGKALAPAVRRHLRSIKDILMAPESSRDEYSQHQWMMLLAAYHHFTAQLQMDEEQASGRLTMMDYPAASQWQLARIALEEKVPS